MRTSDCHWSNAGSPRFRRDPFLRDGVFDHGRASVPRITAPHMLPSTLLTASASANCCLSRLNSPPHRIVVYASRPPLPTTPQHSLPGARYGLPGPDLHRLDRASLPGAQAIQCVAPDRRQPGCYAGVQWALTRSGRGVTTGASGIVMSRAERVPERGSELAAGFSPSPEGILAVAADYGVRTAPDLVPNHLDMNAALGSIRVQRDCGPPEIGMAE
jgi:hypothetical protein